MCNQGSYSDKLYYRALVPSKSRSVVSKAAVKNDDFKLVDGRVDLQNRDEVKAFARYTRACCSCMARQDF